MTNEQIDVELEVLSEGLDLMIAEIRRLERENEALKADIQALKAAANGAQ